MGFGQRSIDDMSFAWVSYVWLDDEEFAQAAGRACEAKQIDQHQRNSSRRPMHESPNRTRAAVVAGLMAAGRWSRAQQLESHIPVRFGPERRTRDEGWERNADGSFTLVFGYMNRNYDERPEIPVGPNNSFSPEPIDRGQPTHFYPRRQQFMFKVRVPATFGKQQLVWTLTRAGKTKKAVGKLDLSGKSRRSSSVRTAAGWASDAVVAPVNLPPTISVDGPAQLNATVGTPLTLDVTRATTVCPSCDACRGSRPGRRTGRLRRRWSPSGSRARCSSKSFSRIAKA